MMTSRIFVSLKICFKMSWFYKLYYFGFIIQPFYQFFSTDFFPRIRCVYEKRCCCFYSSLPYIKFVILAAVFWTTNAYTSWTEKSEEFSHVISFEETSFKIGDLQGSPKDESPWYLCNYWCCFTTGYCTVSLSRKHGIVR